jgi:arabinose-5-phosphate isomerase
MDRKIHRAQEILNLEAEAIKSIPLDENLLTAVDLIVNCKGKVIASGMGKAGIIAKKVASTMSSTGTPSLFMHPGEAQHGDLGMLSKDDILLLFSNSGKTRELIELVALGNRLYNDKVHAISITANAESDLAKISDATLCIGNVTEACSLGMAPTTSTTAMLALGDVLSMLVMEEKQIYKRGIFKTSPRRIFRYTEIVPYFFINRSFV